MAQSAQPTQAMKAVAQPSQPSQAVQPTQPTQPARVVRPSQSTRPSQPAQASQVSQAAQPTRAMHPLQSDQTTRIGKAARSGRQARSASAVKPAQVAQAASTDQSDSPRRSAQAEGQADGIVTTNNAEKGAVRGKSRRSVRFRVAVISFGVVLVAFLVAVGLFSWNRWYRFDDWADLQGTWYAVGTSVPITIDEDSIRFDEKTAYGYTVDTGKKAIGFSLGNLNGQGHYRFCDDRNCLVIEDGAGYSEWGTAIADLKVDISDFVATITDGEMPLPEGDGVIALCREPNRKTHDPDAQASGAASSELRAGDTDAQTSDTPEPSSPDSGSASSGERSDAEKQATAVSSAAETEASSSSTDASPAADPADPSAPSDQNAPAPSSTKGVFAEILDERYEEDEGKPAKGSEAEKASRDDDDRLADPSDPESVEGATDPADFTHSVDEGTAASAESASAVAAE